jgi:hypothetical protein
MTPRERVSRLEGLLDRILRNAARPRAPRAVAPAAAKPSAPDSTPAMLAVQAVEPAAMGPASDVPPPSSVPTAPPAADSLFPTAPPVAAAAPAPEPVAAPPAAPPPAISSVPPWKPEPMSTVQARPSSMPPEELSDEDLVEVTTLPPAPSAEDLASSAPQDEMEEPPASSSRSKVAETLDQAIASAAAHPDELEVPIHTPPPESGPQEAVLPLGIDAPRAPDFADDLEREVERPASLGPTPEQLGETIELEVAEGPELEIDDAVTAAPEPSPERPVEELELALPRAEMPSGTYDVSISMPAASFATSAMPTIPTQQGPEVTARSASEGTDVTRVIRAGEGRPETFVALLDASLAL